MYVCICMQLVINCLVTTTTKRFRYGFVFAFGCGCVAGCVLHLWDVSCRMSDVPGPKIP